MGSLLQNRRSRPRRGVQRGKQLGVFPRSVRLALGWVVVGLLMIASARQSSAATTGPDARAQVGAFLEHHCIKCHGDDEPEVKEKEKEREKEEPSHMKKPRSFLSLIRPVFVKEYLKVAD